MNILISSTLTWNPGDEFIRMGVKKLIGKHHTYVVWNRNPDVMSLRGRALSNSAWNNIDVSLFDLVVFAGTPQWLDPSSAYLYRELIRHPQVPAMLLGVGCGENANFTFSPDEHAVLARDTTLITTRGPACTNRINELLGEEKATTWLCPAAFCRLQPPSSERAERLIILQSDSVQWQRISRGLVEKMLPLATNADLLCLYIDEWKRFRSAGLNPIFCDSPADYLDVMSQYRQVISTRLHGAIAALSCGCHAQLVLDPDNFRIVDAQTPFGKLLPVVQPDALEPWPPVIDSHAYLASAFLQYRDYVQTHLPGER